MAINPPSSPPILPPPAAAAATMSLTYYTYPTNSSHRLQIFSAFHLTKQGSSSSSKAPPLPPPAAFALATHEIVAISDTNAAELEKFLAFKEESGRGSDEERSWRNGALVRRKRRRKRRRDDGFGGADSDSDPLFLKPESSGKYLTAKQEAEYTFCLQEEARVVGVKKKSQGDEVSFSEWAKAAGMSKRSLDKILCNGREAEDRITRCYRRLVISVASSYLGRGLSLQDLIQEGNLGLIHGAKKFNPARGYKLSTYVYWWIKQAMARAIAKKSRITRLPPVLYRVA